MVDSSTIFCLKCGRPARTPEPGPVVCGECQCVLVERIVGEEVSA